MKPLFALCMANHRVLTRTRRVPHMEQELHTLAEQMTSPLDFSGVRVSQSYFLSSVL